MSWGRHFDDLAAATSALLIDGPDAWQITEPVTALAARDTVLVQLRQLVGAVCEAPRFCEVKPLLLNDIVDRPGKALHQALSALPRTVDFGASEMPAAVDLTLPAYDQHWQRAALAAWPWRSTSTRSAGCPTGSPGSCFGTWRTSPTAWCTWTGTVRGGTCSGSGG